MTKKIAIANQKGDGGIPDALFDQDTRSRSSELMEISVQRLIPSSRNPYRVNQGPDDPRMRELCESIRANGILSPLIVRPVPGTDTYEIISGHRRHFAAQKLGLANVPVIIRDLTDDEAAIQMVDYNLNREELLCSEKAFAYRLKYEAIKHTWGGNRQSQKQELPGDSCSDNALNTIAQQIGISPASVRNYLNLTRLCKEILDAVDRKEIPMKAGVQLSYIKKDTQRIFWKHRSLLSEQLTEDKAEEIRRYFEQHPDSTEPELKALLTGKALENSATADSPDSEARQAPVKRFRLTKAVKRRYFPPETTEEEICDIIHTLLHEWAVTNNPDYK